MSPGGHVKSCQRDKLAEEKYQLSRTARGAPVVALN